MCVTAPHTPFIVWLFTANMCLAVSTHCRYGALLSSSCTQISMFFSAAAANLAPLLSGKLYANFYTRHHSFLDFITTYTNTGHFLMLYLKMYVYSGGDRLNHLSVICPVQALWHQTLLKTTSRDGLQPIKLTVKNKCPCVWALTSLQLQYSKHVESHMEVISRFALHVA